MDSCVECGTLGQSSNTLFPGLPLMLRVVARRHAPNGDGPGFPKSSQQIGTTAVSEAVLK